MNTLSYKTLSANSATVSKNWVLIDAAEQPLGRMSSIAAKFLRGKYKTDYTPHVDCGDNVIVINADKVALSGNKWSAKTYIRHTGYPGGQRSLTAQELHDKDSTRVVEHAIKGMLPKNKLGSAIYRNLKVYAGATHDHGAQQPVTINLNEVK